jgi:hypothetical protein
MTSCTDKVFPLRSRWLSCDIKDASISALKIIIIITPYLLRTRRRDTFDLHKRWISANFDRLGPKSRSAPPIQNLTALLRDLRLWHPIAAKPYISWNRPPAKLLMLVHNLSNLSGKFERASARVKSWEPLVTFDNVVLQFSWKYFQCVDLMKFEKVSTPEWWK